jgi:hypothetical protein
MNCGKHLDPMNLMFLVTIMLGVTLTELAIHIHHNAMHLPEKREKNFAV